MGEFENKNREYERQTPGNAESGFFAHIYRTAFFYFILGLLFVGGLFTTRAGVGPGGHDIRSLFYFWFDFSRAAVFDGRLPLWDASSFAGYPFISNPQVALFYPPTWLAILPPVANGIVLYILFHLVVAGLGMYLLVRETTGSRDGAFLAGLSFAFAGFVSARLWAGHIGLLATDSWLPWLLLGLQWSVRRGTVRSGLVAGIPFAMAILAGHTTSLLYIGLAWGAFLLYLLREHGQWRLVMRQFGLSVGMGLLLSGVQLLPLAEFSLMSSRATEPTLEFATAFSMPPAHLITFLVPDFFGEPVRAGYWSVPSFDELTYYIGVLPLLGLILALLRPNRRTWLYILLLVLGILLALGSYGFLYPLFYTWLPPFRLARAPGRAAFLVVFAGSALLGEAVAQWARRPSGIQRTMQSILGIGGVALLAALAATGAVFAAQHPSDTSGRLWHQLGGWGTALLLLLAGGGLLWAYVARERHRSRITLALAFLVVTDLWLFGYPLLQLDEMTPAPLWSDVAAVIGDEPGRILPWGISIFDQNGAMQNGLDSVFGYNALEVGANIAFAASIPDPRSTAYDILGARYVVSTAPLDQYLDGERPLTPIAQTGRMQLYERSRVLPLARLVYAAEVQPTAGAAIARVHAPDFDPAATVILAEEQGCDGERDPGGSAEIVAAEDGFWRIVTRSETPAWLVLSETAYPGWEVTIDGRAAEWETAYTAVRAVCVPAGVHEVEWVYRPAALRWGALLSLLGLTLLWTTHFRRRRAA